ncbi:MAG: hypothetical protein Q9225_007660, partial [Loekoesia sp. 1 TL-2023]
MGKTIWNNVKKGAKTEKPEPPQTVNLRAQAQSTKKKGTAYRRFMDKLNKRENKMNKEKAERGEERPAGRTHH